MAADVKHGLRPCEGARDDNFSRSSSSSTNVRILRQHIVQAIISFCDVIFSELPPKIRGDIVYYFHLFGFGAVLLYTALWGKRFALQIVLLGSILILTQLYFLRGCVLTKVEQYYRKEKGTTVDIFLWLFGFPCTNENRKLISIIGYSLTTAAFALLYVRETVLNTRL